MTALRSTDIKDSQLEEGIYRALLGKGINFWIRIIARDGYIHLFGFVDALKDKWEIDSIVESFPGVRIVTNHLRLKGWEEKREGLHF